MRLLLAGLLALPLACGGGSGGAVVVVKGARLLGVDVTEAQGGDYDAAFQIARGAGMDVVGIFVQWDTVETAPETYDDTLFSIINAFYPAQGMRVDLTLAVINTTVNGVPADLQALTFDDPVMIERFKRFLDFALDTMPAVDFHALNIGSEMDIFFGADAAAWARFKTFYDAAVDHLHARDPSLVVTVEPTYDGLMGPMAAQARALNERSDAIAVSYYPFEPNQDVAPPSRVHTDLDALVAAYPSRPIFFLQFGYPSSPLMNSSEARQAEFVREAFQAWDRHAQNIELIDFTWLHDLDPADVDGVMQFYGFVDPKFAAFLGTLGLRTFTGADKQGFLALRAEAAARGW